MTSAAMAAAGAYVTAVWDPRLGGFITQYGLRISRSVTDTSGRSDSELRVALRLWHRSPIFEAVKFLTSCLLRYWRR